MVEPRATLRSYFMLCLLLLLPALACSTLRGSGSESPERDPTVVDATTSAEPTATSTTAIPTVTQPPPEPTALPPTQTPEPVANDPPSPGADASLAAEPYTHPQDFITVYPPLGWEITDDDGTASFEAPDGSGFVHIQVTNTGYELDADAFTNFVRNRDLNFFSEFDSYVKTGEDVDVDLRVATMSKSLSFEGTVQSVVTLYDQYGPIIYSLDFWATETHAAAYEALFAEMVETASQNAAAAQDQVVYNWIYTFVGPDDLFSFEVPTPWEYERTEGEYSIVDTFYSPDGHGIVQNIAYDDGETVSRTEAGQFALELLRGSYANDINIISDEVQPDGSERLIWESPNGDYAGTSFFETRGTTFLLLTTLYDIPFEDIYLETLDYTIESYAIPE